MLITNLITDTVDRFCHFIRRMPRDIFTKRRAEYFAPGSSSTPREAFYFLKNIVGNGNSGFHTRSITDVRLAGSNALQIRDLVEVLCEGHHAAAGLLPVVVLVRGVVAVLGQRESHEEHGNFQDFFH